MKTQLVHCAVQLSPVSECYAYQGSYTKSITKT